VWSCCEIDQKIVAVAGAVQFGSGRIRKSIVRSPSSIIKSYDESEVLAQSTVIGDASAEPRSQAEKARILAAL
jgi:hypothetical protein